MEYEALASAGQLDQNELRRLQTIRSILERSSESSSQPATVAQSLDRVEGASQSEQELTALIAAVRDYTKPNARAEYNKFFDRLRAMGPSDAAAVPVLIQTLGDPAACQDMLCSNECLTIECKTACHDIVLALERGDTPPPTASSYQQRSIQTQMKFPICRESLIDALGAIGPAAKSASPLLTRLLSDPNSSVRCKAALALEKVAGVRRAMLPLLTKSLLLGNVCVTDLLDKLGRAATPAVPVVIKVLEASTTSSTDKGYLARTLEKIGTPEAKAAAARYKRKEDAAFAPMKKQLEEEEQHENEFAAKWLKDVRWSADEVLTEANKCRSAETKMRIVGQSAQMAGSEGDLATASSLTKGYEKIAAEGTATCQKFSKEYGDYVDQFGDDGVIYLWKYCASKSGAGSCASTKLWLATHG